jgi:hypothetical protein
VAEYHTYFVGSRQGGWSVLAHNNDACFKSAADIERKKNIREKLPESVLGPSGKPKIHKRQHPSRKKAKKPAQLEGKGPPIHHPYDKAKDHTIIRATRTAKKYEEAPITTIPNNIGRPKSDKWIGLFELTFRADNALDQKAGSGAFVTVVGIAPSCEEFCRLVERRLVDMGASHVTYDDVELFAARMRNHEVQPIIHDAARSLSDLTPIAFGTFHMYPEKSDD